MTRSACRASTPIGIFTALYEDGVIRRVLFPNESFNAANIKIDDTLLFAHQLDEYFCGMRKAFSLPFLLPGTPFRQSIYKATLSIGYGETATYSDIANAAGYPSAMRAAGSAMKANPLPILLPCHRVVHKAKKNCAYRGGTDIKHYLLNLESEFKTPQIKEKRP